MLATATLVSYDPATGESVGEVDVTELDDITAIVARARAAQPAWAAMGHDGRAELLMKSVALFDERVEEHARLMTMEQGKPVKEAIAEARSLGYGMKEHLDEIREALAPEVLEDGRLRSTVYHDPLGVVAAITPWNFPMSMPAWLLVPALAAGNTVVLKPSEETPLCGQAFADVLNEFLPEDVLSVVHGADDQGKELVKSDVDMIAFTGSREVGKHIMKSASDGLKRIMLELGGKDPMIVLDDADVERAAKFATSNSFRNCGQVCVSTERIFVHEEVADRFEAYMAEMTASLCVGNGLDEGTDVGPMVNQRQRAHVVEQVAEAVKQGATIAAGGEERDGNFLTPTLLTGITDEMSIAVAETFGPVACVTRVSSNEEAVERANSTPFGLGAVVFGSEGKASTVARQLSAGMIGINRACFGATGAPWVGAQQSGFGFHKSRDGHRQFTQTRVVTNSNRG